MSKRKREKPARKWTEEEVNAVLDYAIEKGTDNFEKPSAKLYYMRLLEDLHINASWDLVQFKMRYLKQKYNEAKNGRQTTGAGIEEEDGDLGKIARKCLHYEKLAEIFHMEKESDVVTLESSTISVEPVLDDAVYLEEPTTQRRIVELEETPAPSNQCRNTEAPAFPSPSSRANPRTKSALSALLKMEEK